MPHVLVVDDDPTIGELVKEVLELEGYRVHVARHPREGLAVVAGDRPDVLLVDLRMPDMDGWAFIRACREQLGEPAPRAVLMSAALPRRLPIEDGLAFLPKPFDLLELLSVIEAGDPVEQRWPPDQAALAGRC